MMKSAVSIRVSRFLLLTLGTAMLLSCNPAAADMAGFGGGGTIPDNNALGFASTITFLDNEEITDLSVAIDFGTLISGSMGHSFVGDLMVTLTGPGGTITLFDRPGVPASTFGDSSNLTGTYTWADGGANFTTAAFAVNNNTSVANATYSAQSANDTFLSLALLFGGTGTAGDWTLRIADRATGDVGGFSGWSLNIVSTPIAIPEPSASVTLAASLLVAGWWTNRSRKMKLRRERRRFNRKFY